MREFPGCLAYPACLAKVVADGVAVCPGILVPQAYPARRGDQAWEDIPAIQAPRVCQVCQAYQAPQVQDADAPGLPLDIQVPQELPAAQACLQVCLATREKPAHRTVRAAEEVQLAQGLQACQASLVSLVCRAAPVCRVCQASRASRACQVCQVSSSPTRPPKKFTSSLSCL